MIRLKEKCRKNKNINFPEPANKKAIINKPFKTISFKLLKPTLLEPVKQKLDKLVIEDPKISLKINKLKKLITQKIVIIHKLLHHL